MELLRKAARKYLPAPIRRRLGWLAGRLDELMIQPAQGLLFDLKGARFAADGCIFDIPKELTTRRYRACFWEGTYEKEERELIARWIRPEDRVLELGACLGVVSCVTNKLLADKGRHVVVEANPLCIPPLTRNKELNQAGFRIEHCAVGNQPEMTFYLHPIYIVGGSSQRATDRPVRIRGKSLRQLEQEHGPFTALIVDVEGSEREIFEESRELLKQYRLIIVELHDFAIGREGVERCRQLLKESGLQQVGQAGITDAWVRSKSIP